MGLDIEFTTYEDVQRYLSTRARSARQAINELQESYNWFITLDADLTSPGSDALMAEKLFSTGSPTQGQIDACINLRGAAAANNHTYLSSTAQNSGAAAQDDYAAWRKIGAV